MEQRHQQRQRADAAFAAFCEDPAGMRELYRHSPVRRDRALAIRCGESGLADYQTFAWFECCDDPDVVMAYAPTVVTVLRDHFTPEIALKALEVNARVWLCVPPPHRDDATFALAAVAANPVVVVYLASRWQRNYGFMLQTAQLHGRAVWHYGFAFGGDALFGIWMRLNANQRRWRRVRLQARLRKVTFWWWEASQRRKYHAEGATLVGSEALRARDELWASHGPWRPPPVSA